MEEQSIKLLQECSAGCKMGISSIEQAKEFVGDDNLAKVMDEYLDKNKKMDKEIDELLEKQGSQPKEPGMAATTFSWISTEIKLKINDDSSRIAKVMMDGCYMAVQSLSKYINDYHDASKESQNLAKKLIKTEEEFMKTLQQFR